MIEELVCDGVGRAGSGGWEMGDAATNSDIVLDTLIVHDRLAKTDNDATVKPSVSVWHLLVSLAKFCSAEGIDLDAELADARDFLLTR